METSFIGGWRVFFGPTVSPAKRDPPLSEGVLILPFSCRLVHSSKRCGDPFFFSCLEIIGVYFFSLPFGQRDTIFSFPLQLLVSFFPSSSGAGHGRLLFLRESRRCTPSGRSTVGQPSQVIDLVSSVKLNSFLLFFLPLP